jgi:serine protease
MLDATENIFDSNDNLIAASTNVANEPLGLDVAANNTEPIAYKEGTLSADNFAIAPTNSITVISGNGNVDFGSGLYDTIDLSDISTEEIVNYNPARIDRGGVVIDPGNGARVFDQLTLADGTEIYFEGIDRLSFADGTQNLAVIPNDPNFELQSGLHMMGVQNAWRFTKGTDDVLIGVQDTGLGINANGDFHPDIRPDETWFFNQNNIGLTGNLADDFLIETGTDSQVQSTSHGTSVQGIIAAQSNNSLGIAGINWNSDVYNIDVLNSNKGDLDLALAAREIIDQASLEGKQLVINLSLGTNGSFKALHPGQSAFETVVANNPDVLFTIAAGNSGHQGQEGLSSPAVLAENYNNVIAVGASWGRSDRDGNPTVPGTRIEYDDWGSQYGKGLTVMSPSEVLTTNATVDGEFNYDPGFNGTSAAAPNVAGVASLVWSANSDLTATEVKNIISETAYDLGSEDYDIFYGHGMVNADAAVRRAIAIGQNSNAA